MFTGIIEEIGHIASVKPSAKSFTITISADKVLENTKVGDSIAVNGVCLTVCSLSDKIFTADVMAETVRRSSLGSLKKGSLVNLERAMVANGRFGGHIVSGHIDGKGTILEFEKEDNAIWITIAADNDILKYIIMKGSIAIDGVSLTVAGLDDKSFRVSIIPHTQSETILTSKKVGEDVNLECDIIGKYVERMLSLKEQPASKSDVSMSFLAENGFL